MNVEDFVFGTSTMTTGLVLRVAEQRGGSDAVARVLDRAGLTSQEALLQNARGRISYPVKLRLFEALATELEDPGIGLSLGALALRDPALAPIWALARTLGTPAEVLRQVSRLCTRLDSGTAVRCVQAGHGTAEVVRRALPPHRPTRVDCEYITGLLTQVPVIFGLPPARVEHRLCQVEGAPQCEYTVRWEDRGRWRRRAVRRPSLAPVTAEHVRGLGDQRLRNLQEAVGDLVSGTSLETTLQRVTERADRAVHAPGHVLDVRLPGGARHRRVRGLGRVALEALEALGDARLEPGMQQIGGVQVVGVPVATAATTHGVLAVVAWPGQELCALDLELLAAYARHAAAAIEMSALLTEAHEQEETARLLLTAARSLAGRRSVQQIAQTVADAVPALCGADRSAVAVWEPSVGAIRIAALSGWPADLAERVAAYVTTPEESPELSQLVGGGRPVLVSPDGSDWARQVLDDFGLAAVGAVPITVDDQLVGLVLAYWVDSAPVDSASAGGLPDALAERLWGLAGLTGVALDNTRLLAELRHRSAHDALTGLPHRTVFESRLQTALDDHAAGESPVTVLMGDVDRLKRINESLGPEAGDEVLREVARRLTSAVRRGDTVARFSGDEFAVLLPGAGPREAEEVLDRIRAALSSPVTVADEDVFVDLVIGIAVADHPLVDRAQRRPQTASHIIEQATEDLHDATARIRGLLSVSEHSPNRLRLETELRGAVGRGEIHLHYQPQIDVADGRVVAVEALARWHHPVLGPVPPGDFVPVAEESGFIRELGEHVLREACRTVAAWQRDGLELEVAVNVSAVQLTDPDFTDLVHRVLDDAGLPPQRLILEVTESQMLSEIAGGHGHLTRLRAAGIGISVDDFGTGYSSLAQLHRLPVTEMKVDRAFIAELTEGTASPLVAGIIGLGHGLGLRIVAEGVETPTQLQVLRSLGCQRAQGYLLGRPATPDDVRHTLVRAAVPRSPPPVL